jgi:hypothetical protein
MDSHNARIKEEILQALAHPEAEDGLYLNNLLVVHEEEERNPVIGTQEEILQALRELVNEGRVREDKGSESIIFSLG